MSCCVINELTFFAVLKSISSHCAPSAGPGVAEIAVARKFSRIIRRDTLKRTAYKYRLKITRDS